MISFNSNNNKIDLCSDRTSYYRGFGPCLDFSLITSEEKKHFSVLVYPHSFSSNQDRVGPSSNQDRVGVGLGHQGPPPLDHGWKGLAYTPI